jgi:aryl-alcohol dehydrogenase-like predicted oxidoreductase
MDAVSWRDSSELRIGLGCMRLPADEQLALDTIVAAANVGLTVFDMRTRTAPTEPVSGITSGFWPARCASGWHRHARIVTKGGMTRPGGAWVSDGRAKTIAADCDASLAALDGLPIDPYLIHAPDPRTSWRTSVRALARLVEQGMVRDVGVANVTHTQLDEALELAPIAAVQAALSALNDQALRGGLVARCTELGRHRARVCRCQKEIEL